MRLEEGLYAVPYLVACFKKEIIFNELVYKIDDSKIIREKKRNFINFYKKTQFTRFASNEEIDQINILNATILSMKRVLKN